MAVNGLQSTATATNGNRMSSVSLSSAIFVKAMYTFSGAESASLSFNKGDIIEVITRLDSGWWDGIIVPNKERGWFPRNYVAHVTDAESEWAREQLELDEQAQAQSDSEGQNSRRRTSTVKANAAGHGIGLNGLLGSLKSITGFGSEDEDLTAFSTGGDIFRELAAASSGSHRHNEEYDLPLGISRRPSEATSDISALGEHWIPRMTDNHQIVYFNSKTGQTTRDLPNDVPLAASKSSSSGGLSASPSSNSEMSLSERKWTTNANEGGVRNLKLDIEALRISAGLDNESAPPIVAFNRPISACSDDSALDAAMQQEGKRRLHALNTVLPPPTPSLRSGQSVSASTATGLHLKDPLAALAPQNPPTMSSLETKANDTLSELIEAAHPRRRGNGSNTAEAENDASRSKLAILIVRAISDIRLLIMAADTFDSAAATDSPDVSRSGLDSPSLESAPLLAYQTEIRPFTRRVTSTLSKLVLSVRAVWGLMGPANAEEAAYLANFADDPDADMTYVRAQREETLRQRADVETKLRWDIVDGAREVSDALIKFVNEVERLLGSPLTSLVPRADRSTLPAVKRSKGVVHLQSSASAPGAGRGGSWRGSGFVTRTVQAPTDAALKTPLGLEALEQLELQARRVAAEVASMRALMGAIVAKANKRASSTSTYSSGGARKDMSAASVVPPVQPQTQPPYTPLQSAGRHLTKMNAHAKALLTALGQYLDTAEDIDVAARIDYDLAPSIAPTLKAAVLDAAQSKGKERVVNDEHIDLFIGTMQKAGPLLIGLERAKQAMYDATPALLLAIHSVGIASATDGVGENAREEGNVGSQPSDGAPLNAFCAPARHADPLASINATLGAIDTGIGFVLEAFQALFSLANEQDLLPAELHKRAEQIRAQISSQAHLARSRASGAVSPGTPGQFYRSSAALRTDGRGPFMDDDDNRSATSSIEDMLYGGRTNSTAMTSVGRQSGDQAPFWNGLRQRHRDSYPSSLASSREGLVPGSQFMARSNTEPSSSGTDGDYSPQQPQSVSTNKLRKFFGDEAPPTSRNRPGQPREEAPPWLEADYDEEISYNLEGLVKGGTLRALVARLTSHETSDHAYLTTFLMTYRTFTSSDELFDQLVARFLIQPPPELNSAQREQWAQKKQNIVQLRTVNVLKIWIESHLWDDDAENILQRATDFATRITGRSSQQIIKVIHSRRVNGSKRIMASTPTFAPPQPFALRNPKKIKFLEIDPLEMARQLTLMDSRLYAHITARECLSKAWPKQLGVETPNITAMTSLGNAITNWVVDTLLRQEDVRKRANLIKHFVMIAERCRSLQNFSTLIHIVAGLYTTPIHRLRRTWDTVNQRTMTTLHELNRLMSPTRNFAEYREAIRTVGPPCVPFLGVFLSSWTFIGDGNPDFLRERPNQINFNKRHKAAELIQQIQLHQSTPYHLADVSPIKALLENALMAEYDDQAMYSMSLALEPREKDDDRVARLLSESGFL